jgi:hypothetical protein
MGDFFARFGGHLASFALTLFLLMMLEVDLIYAFIWCLFYLLYLI